MKKGGIASYSTARDPATAGLSADGDESSTYLLHDVDDIIATEGGLDSPTDLVQLSRGGAVAPLCQLSPERTRPRLPVVVLDVVEGLLRKDELLGPEHVRDGDLVLQAELELGDVALRLVEDLVVLVDDHDRVGVRVQPEVGHQADDGLGFGRGLELADERVDDDRGAVAARRDLVLDRDGDRELGLLLVHLFVGPVLGFGPVRDAAADDERRSRGPAPRSAGALLFVGFAPAAAHFGARFGRGGALASVAPLLDVLSVHDVHVLARLGRAEPDRRTPQRLAAKRPHRDRDLGGGAAEAGC
mmetsp:Transcript_7176/g.29821  ORF Transcript_7176/g.29821 Transcript_7176/m.29821 type:complete len:301 (+) Transcript_7176:42-944(+)